MDQRRRGDKAHGEAFLTGGQTEAKGDMGLASAAVTERDDVLATAIADGILLRRNQTARPLQ